MPTKGIAAHFTASGKASLARPSGSGGKSKPKAKAKATTKTRLRTPEAGEVERIMAETPPMSTAEDVFAPGLNEEEVSFLGAPSPKSPLLEATQRTPISVRTDPDRGKMFLLMSKSSPSVTPTSSPSKRKAMNSPALTASPSKTPKVRPTSPRQLITGEHEVPGSIEEDGLVLTPGRAKGTRIALGSPHKSPLARDPQTRDVHRAHEATLRRVSQEQDEENYLTPRSIRQKPKGLPLPPLATQTAAAIFRSGHAGEPNKVAQSSSAPSLPPANNFIDRSDRKIETVADETPLPLAAHTLSSDLPLPEYYASLMKLHEALEHALVFQLATAGCSSASLQHDSEPDSDSDDDLPGKLKSEGKTRNSSKTVRLPNLITYSVLRPRVEQSGKRRLGPTELKRLASVWLNFPDKTQTSLGATQDEVKGLGLLITKTRTEDPNTGRKFVDWAIGIELDIKRVHRERTPPPQLGFGGLESASSSPIAPTAATFDPSVPGTPKAPSRFTTPPPSPSLGRRPPSSPSVDRHFPASPGAARLLRSPVGKSRSSSQSQIKAREGMSVVAMWSNGLEIRKAEVARRLRDRCARYHQLWLNQQGISSAPTLPTHDESSAAVKKEEDAITPVLDGEEERKAVMGAGGLWTPSATRSGGRRAGKRMFALDPSQLDNNDESDSEGETAQVLSTLPSSHAEARKALMDEADPTTTRTSRFKTNASTVTEIPPSGSVLRSWHSEFDLNNPAVVKPVPLADLPSLTEPRGLGIHGAGSLQATPRRNKEVMGLGIGNLTTPHKPVKFSQIAMPDTVVSTPSASGNSIAAMRERLQAKEMLRKTQSMSSLSTGSSLTVQSRKAIMPRLEDVCRILFMLFSNGTTRSSTGVWMSPRKPMSEVLDTLGRSLNSQFSRIECREAVNVLIEIAPGFLVVFQADTNDSHQWVKMGRNQDGQQWTASQVKREIDRVQGR